MSLLPLVPFKIMASGDNEAVHMGKIASVSTFAMVLFVIASIFVTWFLVEGILWFKKVIPEMKRTLKNINTAN